MRDPFTWSFPFGRLFGVAIRINIWFPLVALGLILRAAFQPEPEPPAPPPLANLWLDACILVGILFVVVLLHELAHLFAARMVDGDAHEIMLWPLGGLGNMELPQSPQAHFVTALAGPALNLFLCAAAGLFLVYHSLLPPWSPTANQLAPRLYNWADGRYYYDTKYQQNPERLKLIQERDAGKPAETPVKAVPAPTADKTPTMSAASVRAIEPEVGWLSWVDLLAGRFFWINWVLLLFNLLPAFPLDGGRMLQALYWSRGDYRQATQSAIVAGFIVMIGVLIVGLVANEFFLLLLAWVIYTTGKTQLYVLETGGEEPAFGYDFSQGYTSLEPDAEQAPRPPRPRRQNFIQRWLQRRAERKQQREQERTAAEERRLDELLEKIALTGKQSLTDEERRFLDRVSSRYKNRQS